MESVFLQLFTLSPTVCLLYWRVFLQYGEQGHGFARMRAYAERLGGRLIVEPTGPVGGASATGAAVYLQKVAGMDQVLGMMKSAAAGEGRLPTEVVRRVFDRLRRGARAKDVNLTQREKEFRLVVVFFISGLKRVKHQRQTEPRGTMPGFSP